MLRNTLNEKVVFQGDRLEDLYSDEAGQWGLEFPIEFEYEGENVYFTVSRGGVWLDRSADSQINHAVFKNGTIGIWVDSVATGSNYALNITNTEITNMTAVGLLSQGGHIRGVNNLLTDCGEACGAFTIGGKIEMHLSTFATTGQVEPLDKVQQSSLAIGTRVLKVTFTDLLKKEQNLEIVLSGETMHL